jgi:hypothetical protein
MFFDVDEPPSNRPGAFARPKTPKNSLAVSPETAFDTYQTAVSACEGRIHR